MGGSNGEQMGGGLTTVGFFASAAMGGVLNELTSPVTLTGGAFALAAMGLPTDMADAPDGYRVSIPDWPLWDQQG